MAKAKATLATESIREDDDLLTESEHEDDTSDRERLKKKRPNLFNKYYPNCTVENELDRLRQTVEKLKAEKKIYKNNIEWTLENIGIHTIAHSVVIGDGAVIVDSGEGNKENMKTLMTRHFKKVTCELAAITHELATLKNIINISSTSLQNMSKKSDKKLGTVLELLEMTIQSDEDVTRKIDRALVELQKWSMDSKRTFPDMYKVTSDQAPKEALSTIQFVASKCVDTHSRATLQTLLCIDPHAMEDTPSDQNMCFRGLVFWRQKDTENHNAEQLKKLLQELDKITQEERERVSKSVLKLTIDESNIMDGMGKESFIRIYRNVAQTLAHVTSISQKLASIEQRDILKQMEPDDSVVVPAKRQSWAGVPIL